MKSQSSLGLLVGGQRKNRWENLYFYLSNRWRSIMFITLIKIKGTNKFKHHIFAYLGLLFSFLFVSCDAVADLLGNKKADLLGSEKLSSKDSEKPSSKDSEKLSSKDIQINFTTLSIPLRKQKKLQLKHINGSPFDYVVVNDGNCVTLEDDKKGNITVKAGNKICQQTIKINIGDEEKIINLRAYYPFYMDIGEGLLIRYTYFYSWIWNDKNSRGAESATFSHPKENGIHGWYALGSQIRPNYNFDVEYMKRYPMIMVKDNNKKGLLKSPKSYKLLWNDYKSGATHSGSLWMPICPSGFSALGIVANKGHGQPSKNAVRCVKKTYVQQANIGKKVYNDRKSGAQRSVNVNEITLKKTPVINDPNKAPLLVGTFTVNYPNIAKPITNFLLIPKIVANKSENEVQPELTGRKRYDGYAKFFSAVRLPFSMIKQLMMKPEEIPEYVAYSPFIYLQRRESYKSLNSVNSQLSTESELSYSTEASFEETATKEFTQTVGLSVTAGGEAGFLGNGGSWEVSVNTEFSWRSEIAKTYGSVVSRELTITVAPKKFVEVLQIYTEFQALNEAGRRIGNAQPLTSGGDNFLILEYPK